MPFKFADVENEYKNNTNLKKEDVEALLEWSRKQPHLPKITELQAILFLHSCYYRIEAPKVSIDNYFTVQTLCPHIFNCAEKEVLSRTLSLGFIRMLPTQTAEGYYILMVKLLDCKPKNFNAINFIKLMNMVSTLHVHQHGTANGYVALIDYQGVSLGHSSHLTPANLMAVKQFLYYVQEAAPVRIKGIHLINLVPLVDKVITMIKPFLKKELIDMMKLHSTSIETLYDYIPKKYLPKDYQGELPTIQTLQEETTKNLLENWDFFQWHDAQKVDETKRVGKPKNVNSMFGVEGSFKKLEID